MYEKVFNSTIKPRIKHTKIPRQNLAILWTKSSEQVGSKINHFVPVFLKHKLVENRIFDKNPVEVVVEPQRKMMKLDGKGFGKCYYGCKNKV